MMDRTTTEYVYMFIDKFMFSLADLNSSRSTLLLLSQVHYLP